MSKDTAKLAKRTCAKWIIFFSLFVSSCFAQKAFAQQTMQFELPLIVNNGVSGDITSTMTMTTLGGEEQTKVSLPVARLRVLLANFANEDQLTSWLSDDADHILLTTQQLRDRGLDIVFDPGLLELNAKVPRLGVQSVSIRGRKKPLVENHFQQSNFASGLNYRLRNQYSHKASRGAKQGFRGLQADLTGFTSVGGFGGWSLFYEANYDETEDTKLARENVTLIHDSYESGLRYSLGDVRPTVSRFQTSPDMLGISIERNYSEINPFRNLRPSGRSTFTLEREATVSFEVNGVVVSQEELPQGTYSISDFPLATGSNDVRVYVDDGVGRVEVSNFSAYVDISLLAAGITNYGVTVGAQRERSSSRQREYGDDISLLAFYERGINTNLTLGAQTELSDDHSLLSSSAIYGNRLGVFALEAAVSKRQDHETGTAALLQYNYRGISGSSWSTSYSAQASYRTSDFISLNELEARGEEWALNASTSFSKSGQSFSFGGQVGEIDDLLASRLRVSHSRQIAGFSLSLAYQYENIEGQGGDNRLSLTLLKTLSNSRIRSQYKTDKQEFRTDWVGDSIREAGQSRSRISATMRPDSDSIDLNSRYIGSNFEATYQHRADLSKLDGADDNFLSTLTVSGSAGYADGAFAYGRPFNDGFLIVDRHKTLKNKKVSIMRGSQNGDAVARFKRKSKTLVPISNSYRTELFAFAVDDLPTGYDIGGGEVKLYPGTLSGFRYQLGSDASNTVMGKVFWPDGTPLNLTSGKVVPVNGGEEGVVFTNRTGRFVAEKLRFGDYRIIFGENDEFGAQFTVTEGDEPGLVMVGNITLEKSL